MSIIAKFEFEGNQVRIVTIDGEPWFVALDVLRAIGSSTTVTIVEAMVRQDLGDDFVSNQVIPRSRPIKNPQILLKVCGFCVFLWYNIFEE